MHHKVVKNGQTWQVVNATGKVVEPRMMSLKSAQGTARLMDDISGCPSPQERYQSVRQVYIVMVIVCLIALAMLVMAGCETIGGIGRDLVNFSDAARNGFDIGNRESRAFDSGARYGVNP